MLSFWRGNTAAVLRVFPTMAFNFAFNDGIKRLVVGIGGEGRTMAGYGLQHLLIGATSGTLTCLLVHPLELMQTKMAADVGKGSSRSYSSLS